MYKLCFFVPPSHVEAVKQAIFKAGAGKIGDYDSCSWQVLGTGQFRPLSGSDPYIGQVGKVEQVEEYRVETLCAPEHIKAIVKALRHAHPYEEPAFDVLQVVDESTLMAS